MPGAAATPHYACREDSRELEQSSDLPMCLPGLTMMMERAIVTAHSSTPANEAQHTCHSLCDEQQQAQPQAKTPPQKGTDHSN